MVMYLCDVFLRKLGSGGQGLYLFSSLIYATVLGTGWQIKNLRQCLLNEDIFVCPQSAHILTGIHFIPVVNKKSPRMWVLDLVLCAVELETENTAWSPTSGRSQYGRGGERTRSETIQFLSGVKNREGSMQQTMVCLWKWDSWRMWGTGKLQRELFRARWRIVSARPVEWPFGAEGNAGIT